MRRPHAAPCSRCLATGRCGCTANDAAPPPRHIGRDTSVEAGIYPHYLYSWSNELLRRQPRVGQLLLQPSYLRERLVHHGLLERVFGPEPLLAKESTRPHVCPRVAVAHGHPALQHNVQPAVRDRRAGSLGRHPVQFAGPGQLDQPLGVPGPKDRHH